MLLQTLACHPSRAPLTRRTGTARAFEVG